MPQFSRLFFHETGEQPTEWRGDYFHWKPLQPSLKMVFGTDIGMGYFKAGFPYYFKGFAPLLQNLNGGEEISREIESSVNRVGGGFDKANIWPNRLVAGLNAFANLPAIQWVALPYALMKIFFVAHVPSR